MTEEDYKLKIRSLLPKGNGVVSSEVIHLLDEALNKYPESYQLWLWKGYSIQLGPEDGPYELEDAINCYAKAIEIEPNNPEAYEDMAHFCDAVMDDEIEAKKWLKMAKSKVSFE